DPDVSPAAKIGPEEVARCIPLAGRLSPTVDSRDRVIPDVGLTVRHVEQALDPDLDQGRIGNAAEGDGPHVGVAGRWGQGPIEIDRTELRPKRLIRGPGGPIV